MRFYCLSSAVVSLFTVAACGADVTDDFALLQAEVSLLNAQLVNCPLLNGWEAEGEVPRGVTVNGGSITITKNNGSTLSGADLVGVKMSVRDIDSTKVKLTIDSISKAPNSDTYQYEITVKNRGKRSPLCGIDAATSQPIKAVPLLGIYDGQSGGYTDDNTYVTFACVNAALGKCALWGYAPWATQQECNGNNDCKDHSLKSWHAACVHMVRADYCGDGVAHTRTGTPINVWDNFEIQPRTASSWEMEAEWTAGGAQCIRHTRWVTADSSVTSGLTDLQYIQNNCPQRLAINNAANCDAAQSNFLTAYGYNVSTDSRHLLRNESAPPLSQ